MYTLQFPKWLTAVLSKSGCLSYRTFLFELLIITYYFEAPTINSAMFLIYHVLIFKMYNWNIATFLLFTVLSVSIVQRFLDEFSALFRNRRACFLFNPCIVPLSIAVFQFIAKLPFVFQRISKQLINRSMKLYVYISII